MNQIANKVSPNAMVVSVIVIFVLAILGAVFTPTLQTQVESWSENLTTAGQTAASSIVDLIPLLYWVLLSVGIILYAVHTFLPGKLGGL